MNILTLYQAMAREKKHRLEDSRSRDILGSQDFATGKVVGWTEATKFVQDFMIAHRRPRVRRT